MIGIDWGTSSFRAFRIAPDGSIRDRRSGPRGILKVQDGRFADTLREEIGKWLAAGESRVLLCGMIGSRQGWIEAPYLPCPAGSTEIAAALTDIPFDWAQVKLVPGLSAVDSAGVPELLRGEESQLLGALASIGATGYACLPGSHSKWVRIEGSRIVGFETYMTGESFAALRGQTILGRTMRDGAGRDGAGTDPSVFARGVARSGERGGLLHHLFGVRSLALGGGLAEAEGASYLSGILIGHEVRAALGAVPRGSVVHVIGAPDLTAFYADAIAACGGMAERLDGEAAARGLALVGSAARWN